MSKRDNVSQTQRTRDKLNNSEMSSSQIAAAKILLSKTVPDVKQIDTQLDANIDTTIKISWGE